MSKKQIRCLCEDGIEKSVPHDHHLSLGNPWDGFFYSTLTLMIDSYSHSLSFNSRLCVFKGCGYHQADSEHFYQTNPVIF